jgi:hypothetical protein
LDLFNSVSSSRHNRSSPLHLMPCIWALFLLFLLFLTRALFIVDILHALHALLELDYNSEREQRSDVDAYPFQTHNSSHETFANTTSARSHVTHTLSTHSARLKTVTMAIEIQFDPFNFALSTMLVILMVAELYFARRERRQVQSEQAKVEMADIPATNNG